jgi:hypothetical protein
MPEPPPLTPERFEILVVRELRKAGLDVSPLRVHRRATWSEPGGAYLLELTGELTRAGWRRRVLITCRRQNTPIARADVEAVAAHVREAGVEAGVLFGTSLFDPDALKAADRRPLALLRVVDGRAAHDTTPWGSPGHAPAWLPAYCATTVYSDLVGTAPRYEVLEARHGELLQHQLGGGALETE